MRSFINAMRWSVTAPIGTFTVDLLVLLSVVQTFAVMRLDETNAVCVDCCVVFCLRGFFFFFLH